MSANQPTARPKLRKRLIIVIVAVLILFALLVGFNTFKGIMIGKFMKSMANPPQTVSTMVARYQDWQPHVEAFGNVRAVHGADLAFDVSGLVDSVEVKSGSGVKKGDVLIKLKDTQDRATLEALRAKADLAEVTAKRAKQQLAVKAISQASYDAATADLKNAKAQADAQAALVAKKTLRAPFAGRIGIITANPGQYINAGASVVTVQQLDPLYVDFTVPQSSLQQMQVGSNVEITADAFAGKSFAGKVSATDPKVDVSTRNVGVEATVPNPDELLVPGMFAKVAVDAGSEQRYLTLPQTSVAYAPYGDTVFVVHEGQPPSHDENGKPVPAASAGNKPEQGKGGPSHYVQQVIVQLGPTRGDQVAIVSGIKEGDVIVTSGQSKLKNGTPVNITNKVEPAFDPNPPPVEE
ncbi:MAG: efflux RND transporter periplasmic adaptor subunit [Rhodanobacteraceae bacterium]